MNETEPNTCPQCGKRLPTDAPEGLCPSCLMAMNLATETRMSAADSVAAKAPQRSPEEMAEQFPNFEITECLGRGGMGVVYKARQKALDREVAIKVLAGEWQDDSEFAKRFEREAKTLAQMSHPNIVTVHNFGESDGLYYIVMEYVDGVNLRDLLSDGKMKPEQALAIVPPVCEALEYAHRKGVVHRDIKPENLLLDRDGRVKIADFGIASLVGSTADVSGTPSYMAPEQLSGNVDRRADIYALGVVLYEMLTGERPDKDVVAPSRKVEVDVKIDEMVLRALEKEPELRYQTAREFQTTAELAMTPPPSARREDAAPTATRIAQGNWQSPDSGWGWFIGKLFGITFTSPTAYKVANLSALGFLGFLGFLGNFPLPGANLLFGLYGLFGLLGLIGVAFMIELPHRMNVGHGPGSESLGVLPPDAAASPWPRRIFWLLASMLVTAPLVLLAMLLALQAARLGVGNLEAVSWLTGAAVLAILAFVPPVMFLLSLRRHPADAPNTWPRRIVLLLCAVPAVLLGLFVLLLVLYMWASESDGKLPRVVAEESQAHFRSLDRDSAPVMDEVLAALRTSDEAEAVGRFLNAEWSARPLFEPGSLMALSEAEFMALPVQKRTAAQADILTQVTEIRDLTKAVQQAGQEAMKQGDFDRAQVCFESLQRCGVALNDPNGLLFVRTVGRAIETMAEMDLGTLSDARERTNEFDPEH